MQLLQQGLHASVYKSLNCKTHFLLLPPFPLMKQYFPCCLCHKNVHLKGSDNWLVIYMVRSFNFCSRNLPVSKLNLNKETVFLVSEVRLLLKEEVIRLLKFK